MEWMKSLPYPMSDAKLRQKLKRIDTSLLNCSSSFISLQVKRPIKSLLTCSPDLWPPNSAQGKWLDVYSVYRSNQQLSEACNKLWACAELVHATQPSSQKNNYRPIGEKFSQMFLGGTIIPTLYYAQISAMISMLSLFGCVPILMNKTPLYLVRTKNGWIVKSRNDYLMLISGRGARTWHDQIIKVYLALCKKGVKLPSLSSSKLFRLKSLRNEMHYEVLGDVKMWRIGRARKSFRTYFTFVTDTIDNSLDKLEKVCCVTTGCDMRFRKLKDNLPRLRI